MRFILTRFLLLLLAVPALGQDDNLDPNVNVHFLIVACTKDYSAALQQANSIAENLDLQLDLRGLGIGIEKIGLTWPKEDCERDGWGFPCYVPRGRFDDGNYVSIEWSSTFEGFTKGYYLVIIASQGEYDKELKKLLRQARKYVPGAYIKSSLVYMGCLH